MRWLICAALLVCAACGPRVYPAAPTPYPVATPAENEAAVVHMIAEGLQLNPATDPATRADPYPCARATYAAEQQHTPLPRCYYLPTGVVPVAVGWRP